MLGKLILLFVVVPLTDLCLLLVMASYVGWRTSIGLVIVSGVIGAWLAKLSYQGVVRKFLERGLNQGLSMELLTDGMMIFFAAGMLLTPGFITDAVGLTLLIPRCRAWYRTRLANWFRRNATVQFTQFSTSTRSRDEGVVDGEVQQPKSKPSKGIGETDYES